MSGNPAAKIGADGLRVEQARLARFFTAIDKHRRALDLAIAEAFEGDLDPSSWRAAKRSRA